MPFDPRFLILVGPFILLSLGAQIWVKSAFSRWSRRGTRHGLRGHEVARAVLEAGGSPGVGVEESRGFLSDHYDPRHRVLRLSPDVYGSDSIAAVAVAAHEAGHALQHARGYAPLHLRSLAVPAAGIGSRLALPLILFGFIFAFPPLVLVGVVAFALVVGFQLITLPVEFDASRRAKQVLSDAGLITTEEERTGVSAVLTAAAMTYVAAAVQAIAQLVYFLGFLRGGRQ